MSKAFGTEKKGYRTRDVDAYIAETNAAAAEQRQCIAELKKELEDKDTQLKAFKQKQDLIVKSIVSAVQKAEQIEGLIKQKYASEIAHLNAFHDQWTGYYNKLIESYPLSAELGALNQFNRRISAILTGESEPEKKFEQARLQFESESQRLSKSNRQDNSGFNQTRPDGKKYIGFIPVSAEDDTEMPDFNPEESIRQLLRREALEEEKKAARAAQKPAARSVSKPAAAKSTQNKPHQTLSKNNSLGSTQKHEDKKNPIAATLNIGNLGISDSGFSFEEALNPLQQLSDILKDIGVSPDKK